MAYDSRDNQHAIHSLWLRRHTTKFNGVCYMVQRAAEAIYSDEGRKQVTELNDYYLRNAHYIVKELRLLGYECFGGENAPYIWVDTRMNSWKFFDMLLEKAGVVCTPGAGFGKCGEGYVRISAFNSFENVQKGMEKIKKAIR